MPGFFVEHPLGVVMHSAPETIVDHKCPKCERVFHGKVRKVYDEYREHVELVHFDLLEDCDCCGGFHFPEFRGDCREDWERF